MTMTFAPFDVGTIDLRAGKPGAFVVEASAGTGKTWSITGLVLRLICEEGLSLDEILVVTFTRAAAAELRGRIADRLAEAEFAVERVVVDGRDAIEAIEEPFFREWLKRGLGDGDDLGVVGTWLDRIRGARRRVDSATFATIHSFCQRMLEWHAFESGQPLGLSFVEDEQKIIDEITNDLWAKWVLSAPPVVLAHVGVTSNEFLAGVGLALEHRTAAVATPSLNGYRPLDVFASAVGSSMTAVASALTPDLRKNIADWLCAMAEFIRAKEFGTHFPEYKNEPSTDDAATKVASVLSRGSGRPFDPDDGDPFWLKVIALYGQPDSGIRELVKSKKASAPTLEALLVSEAREALMKLNSSLPLDRSVLRQELWAAATDEARQRMTEVLASRSEATFDDLIRKLNERVLDEAARGPGVGPLTRAIRGRYRAALIDEFQDTDDEQWALFERVFLDSEEHRLFLIGDPKQAIYAFRGADIGAYLRARDAVVDRALDRGRRDRLPDGYPGVFTMKTNYRSDGTLIVALNRLLGSAFTEDESAAPGTLARGFFDTDAGPSGIDYVYVDWVRPRPPNAGEGCLGLASSGGEGATTDLPSRLAPSATSSTADWTTSPLVFRHVAVPVGDEGAAMLANNEVCMRVTWEAVAVDIVRLLSSGLRVGTGDDGRSVVAGDIAVLVHSWANGRAIADALRARRVPVVIGGGSSVYASGDALDLHVVLSAVIYPRRRALLHTALATPLMSLPASALRRFHNSDDEGISAWAEVFAGWGRVWERQGLLYAMEGVFQQRVSADGLPVVDEVGGPTRVEALLRFSDGERRLTNLRQLVELLHAEASGGFASPDALLQSFAAARARSSDGLGAPDDPRAQRLDTDADAVRILTVHGSKGLEFPFVFLPTTCVRSQSHSPNPPVALPSPTAEPSGAPQVSRTLYLDDDTIAAAGKIEKLGPEARGKRLQAEESRRLLYVALTRAKHQVVVYAREWYDGQKKKLPSAADLLKHPVATTELGGALTRSAVARQWIDTNCDAPSGADAPMFGELIAELDRFVNPVGAQIFAPMRTPVEAEVLSRSQAVPLPPTVGGEITLPDTGPFPRPRFTDPAWRMTSFSSLAVGADHSHGAPAVGAERDGSAVPKEALLAVEESRGERAADDEPDDTLEDSEPAGSTAPPSPDAAFLFDACGLAGRDFGTAVHAILESFDFERANDHDELRDEVQRSLRDHGFQIGDAALDATARDLAAYLRSPLGGPFPDLSLSRLRRSRRLDELAFLIPFGEQDGPASSRLTVAALADAFSVGGPPGASTSWASDPGAWGRWLEEVRTLSFREVAGYLTGFIDLVFSTGEDGDERYAVLDYKTNRLHRDPALARHAYDAPALVDAMIRSRYVLQYHLYVVALQRYLRTRLRDYDYDTHIAGVFYPFVRGVETDARRGGDAVGPRRGVFFDRPPRERVAALDALFTVPSSRADSRTGAAR